MDVTERARLVERYRDGYRAVTEALEGITNAELDARPGPDEWTGRQIAHHLGDGEMTSAVRLRRLVAEDRPEIQGYPEATFAERLHYDRPIAASLEAFRAARASTAELLDRLTEEEWAREGTHSESGPYSVEEWLRIYASHAHDHAEQIRRARMGA